jgi:NitT/TauT family transport system permease protein
MMTDPIAGRRSSVVGGVGRIVADAAPPVIAIALGLILWEAFTRVAHIPEYLLPPPSAVFGTLTQLSGFLISEAMVTVQESLLGLLMGAVLGVALGVLMTHSRFAERAIYPIAVAIRSTPFIAIAPVFIIWFGFTIFPKAIVAMLATFFPMLVNTITGLRSVDPEALEFFQSVNASTREIFWHLRAPGALPHLFAALRLSVSLCLIGAIVGELAGAQHGLGYVIGTASQNLRTSTVFSGMIVLGVIGIVLSEIVSLAEGRVLYWHPSQRSQPTR